MASRKRAASDTGVIETRRRRIEHSTHHAVPQNWPLGADGRSLLVDCIRELTEEEKSTAGSRTHACRLCFPVTLFGNVIEGSVAGVRLGAIDGALQLLRATLEVGAEEHRAVGELDPYKFWKSLDDEVLQTLRPLARALLCPPASSVGNERAFSSAGFVDDPLRGRLDDEGLADLVLVRDWALSEGSKCCQIGFRYSSAQQTSPEPRCGCAQALPPLTSNIR